MKCEKIDSGLVEVGDFIRVENFMGISNLRVTRVTKTMSLCKRKKDGFEHRYTREIGLNMSKPYDTWNTNQYSVWRPL